MKNTFFVAIAALLFATAANAQTDSTQTDTTQSDSAAVAQPGTAAKAQPSNWVTLDSNLPDHLKGTTSSTLKPEHYLPVLGSFQSADATVGAATTNLTVTVDEQNIGIVWIDGLPQGRVKALLKKSPATYKIPAQKTADGKSILEGTLIYDPASRQIAICTGCNYNEENPSAPFTSTSTSTAKSKKVWQYTGTKVDPMAQVQPQVEQQQ